MNYSSTLHINEEIGRCLTSYYTYPVTWYYVFVSNNHIIPKDQILIYNLGTRDQNIIRLILQITALTLLH